MLSRMCAWRMVGPFAAATLLVAMLVMAPTVLAEAPPAQASWHGRLIVHPREPSGPRATLPPIRSVDGWSAGPARSGLGFVHPGGSERVREVQQLLVRIGYRPGRIDGRFGPRTRAAVMAFQYKHGFAQSGVVASRTLNALKVRAGWPAGWAAGAVGRGTGYSSRDGSMRVRQAQRTLNTLGYQAGPVDGLFGPRTAAATLRFQRSRGLPVNGVIGRETARALLIRQPAARPPARAPATVPPPLPPARVKQAPELPTLPLLIALGILGVLVGTVSYVVTGRRLREER